MSGERYEITDASGGQVRITDLRGEHVYLCPVASRTHAASAGAIRQQSRDLDQLRAELAAAVGERDRLRDSDAFSRRELARGNEIIDGLRIERDQLRARLAAIDNAPTVSWSLHGNELIARPAKEST